MERLNLAEPDLTYDADDPPGFRSGRMKLGPALGARQMGMSVYELPPGEAVCPYHYEYAEEEWLLVLEGTPTVRTPAGETTLEPMDVTVFGTGPDGAHEVRNASDRPARVLLASTVVHPAVTVYPDSDKVGVYTGNDADDALFRRATAVPYFTDEPPRA